MYNGGSSWGVKKLRVTTLFMLRPFGGSASAKPQSGLRPLCGFAPAHFFAPVKLLTQFLLSGTKKRQKQRETLCDKNCRLTLKFCILGAVLFLHFYLINYQKQTSKPAVNLKNSHYRDGDKSHAAQR
jgi:hypothetical protein